MENDKELREKFSKVLGKHSLATREVITWEEIFAEIGRLQERANKPAIEKYVPQPFFPGNYPTKTETQPHYHDSAIPCYKNPCVWC